MEINIINQLLDGTKIKTISLHTNGPACEMYVYTIFEETPGFKIKTMVPYVYRRSNMELTTEQEVADYLRDISHFFTKEHIERWSKDEMEKLGDRESVYNNFLKILITSPCKELLQNEFPDNNNPQKIFQTIKDHGFIVPILRGSSENNGLTRYWILPLPNIAATTYETMSANFRKRAINVLGSFDAYEAKIINAKGLLPDHKFSEIRWTPGTAEENPDDMSAEDIKDKFQLLTTQRNQQKREVCRKCKKTGERGSIYGINFFYEGTEKWDPNIPQIGKVAEKGCVGCPWYDIQRWRNELLKCIEKNK